MKWIEKSTHTFLVKSMVIDGRGTPFYMLQNDEDASDTATYRVRAMDFQIEWKSMPKKLRCYVKRLYEDGNPQLLQLRRDLLEDVYSTLPANHTMVITGKLVDDKTNSPYFLLQDSAKLQHRYYYAPAQLDEQYQIGDEIELYVKRIYGNENLAYLDLKARQLNSAESELRSPGRNTPSVEEEASKLVYLPADSYESAQSEWKSSIVFPAGHSTPDMDKQLSVIARTVCGFLNRDGGELLIGVTDKGRVIGIENDFDFLESPSLNRKYKADRDGYELALRDALREKLGNYTVCTYVSIDFQSQGANLTTCVIKVQPSPFPAFFDGVALYIRFGNMTNRLKGEDITRFILDRVQKGGATHLPTVQQEENPTEHHMAEEDDTLEETYSAIGHEPDTEEQSTSSSLNLLPNSPRSKSGKEPYARIARVIVFHKDGQATFEDDYLEPNDDIVWQQEIPRKILTSRHKYSLMQCYESGCINRVPLATLNLNGSGSKNGWNFKDKLFNVFLAHDDDKVAIYTQIESNWHVKVHRLSAITAHKNNLNAQGNLCSKSDNEGCRIYHVTSPHRDIENLMLLDAYRSSRIGTSLEAEDSYDRLTMKTLLEACEEMINH